MDVTVTPSKDGTEWDLADLLGRPMGRISKVSAERFTIHPDGQARETMLGIKSGPFPSLDAALAEIETCTRGTCRRNPGEDHG